MSDLRASGQAPQQPEHPSHVCQRCRNGKKGCDKRLPSCSRCVRLQVPCRYSAPESVEPEVSSAQSQPGLDSASMTSQSVFPKSPFQMTELPPSYTLRQVPIPLDFPGSSGGVDTLNLDETMRKKVHNIIHQSGYEVGYICSRYSLSVHKWFPVVDDVNNLSQYFNGTASVSADIWMLLLSLHLIVKMYDQSQRGSRLEMNRIYLTTKSLFSFISSCRQPTVEHVQSCLLISLYEHCQALHGAAYLSIGICARIGYLLGYNKSLSCDHSDQQNVDTVHNERRLWWCIIILERLVKVQNLQSSAPFAIPTPRLIDLLPSGKDAVHPIATGLSFGNDAQPDLLRVIADSGELSVNVFSSISQATYLLSRVMDEICITRDIQQADWQSKLACLDKTIQSFAIALLRTENVFLQCWSYDICMSALLILNRHEILADKSLTSIQQLPNQLSRAIRALGSVTRMSTDSLIAHPEFLEKFSDAVPIWIVQTAFLASIVEVEYGGLWRGTDGPSHETMLAALKKVLIMFRTRWKLADELYEAISPSGVQHEFL